MDDHPICVVDATTLVDHIQEIKSFVYQGQISLVVPQRTLPLEQRYAKFTEEVNRKPSRQPEPQRPRSGGRPAKGEKSTKTEQPAVDINPLVAGEFLARFRSDDNQKAVEFQRDGEEYSPWRLQELEEESKNTEDTKPTSFAAAARKASLEKFSGFASVTNGSSKPRLVARSAGLDGSPWKPSHKVLSLPIGDISKDVRPLLSCLLWRFHEKGTTLWDKNRTFLLCHDDKINALARKLGLLTKSLEEVRKLCETKRAAKDRRETFGELEEYFNLPEVAVTIDAQEDSTVAPESPIKASAEDANIQADGALKPSGTPELTSPLQEVADSAASASSAKSEKSSGLPERPRSGEALKPTVDGDEDVQDGALALSSEHDDPKLVHPAPRNAVDNDRKQASAKNEPGILQPAQPVFSTLDIEKEHSIAEWVRGLMDAASNSEHGGRDTPMSSQSVMMENPAGQNDSTKPFKPLTYLQAVTGKADELATKRASLPKATLSSPRVSPIREPSPSKEEDPLDSDEERIVFNPKAKRLSAQKTQQAQQAQQAQQSPQVLQTPQVQQVQRPQTPKSSPRHGHTRNTSGGRAHVRGGSQRQPRSGPPPIVIDPDSFGRGLVTNPQPAVARTFSPYGAHGRVPNERRGNHRSGNPRSVTQITPSKVNGVSLPNGSANAHLQVTPEQPPATSDPATEAFSSAQPPVTTPTPSVLKPSPLVGNPSRGHPLPAPSPTVGDFQISNSPGIPLRAERPRYSPRGSPRRMPEPEAGYILKSGQPREATRGRGKLWVP